MYYIVYFVSHAGTFHTQKAGSCNSSGNCLLFCELAQGSQIKGCVYKFNREDKVSFNVFVLAETVKPYTLEEGQYNVSIYDWPWEEDWRANPPAFNEIITVTKPRSKHSCVKSYQYDNVCFFLH